LKIDRGNVNCAPMVHVAKRMLGYQGTVVLLTFLRSYKIDELDTVENVVYRYFYRHIPSLRVLLRPCLVLSAKDRLGSKWAASGLCESPMHPPIPFPFRMDIPNTTR
jgi:hypothetical protein